MVDIDNFTDYFPRSTDMRALVLRKPGQADLETIADPVLTDTNVLLKVRIGGILWQRSEFVPRTQSTRHISSHSGT